MITYLGYAQTRFLLFRNYFSMIILPPILSQANYMHSCTLACVSIGLWDSLLMLVSKQIFF